jgi:TatD DNase family protein
MIYDCHAHLDLFKEKELEKVIENFKKEDGKKIITNAVDFETCLKSLEIAEKFNIVEVALGYYPEDALARENTEKVEHDFEELKKLILENKNKIIAIGEIGMDFHSGSENNHKTQEKLFRQELKLAQEINKPVIVHTRAAEKEILDILADYPKVTKVLHCFCGNMKLVKKTVEIGCYFSIPCSIVRMQNFQRLLEIVPRERILTETDAPYLSPYKEKRNQPAFIKETIKVISKIWNKTEKETENILEENFKGVFGK